MLRKTEINELIPILYWKTKTNTIGLYNFIHLKNNDNNNIKTQLFAHAICCPSRKMLRWNWNWNTFFGLKCTLLILHLHLWKLFVKFIEKRNNFMYTIYRDISVCEWFHWKTVPWLTLPLSHSVVCIMTLLPLYYGSDTVIVSIILINLTDYETILLFVFFFVRKRVFNKISK